MYLKLINDKIEKVNSVNHKINIEKIVTFSYSTLYRDLSESDLIRQPVSEMQDNWQKNKQTIGRVQTNK